MIKRILLFCLIDLLLLNSYLYAQNPWAKDGAVWHYNYTSQLAFGYVKIEKTKDTLRNGILCDEFKLAHHTYNFPGIFSNDSSYVYSYIKNDSLYFTSDSVFHLYAVFNAQPGDTISTYMYSFCGANHFTVDSLGVEIFNSDTLKVLYLTPTVFGYATLPLKLIEKIGYNQQLFEPWPCFVDMPFSSPMRCYSDNSGLNYTNSLFPSCDFILSNSQPLSTSSGFSIYPNPAQNRVKIVLPAEAEMLELIDLYLKKMAKINLQNKMQTELTLPNKGIYFIRVRTGTGMYTHQLVISE